MNHTKMKIAILDLTTDYFSSSKLGPEATSDKNICSKRVANDPFITGT